MHVAAANGYHRVVEFLLDHHVSTDVKDIDDWQPVHAAACWGHVRFYFLLIFFMLKLYRNELLIYLLSVFFFVFFVVRSFGIIGTKWS